MDGHDVLAVTSGTEAIRLLNERQFDVVLTDLRLADVDGIDILKEVQRTAPDTAAIMLTGYASLESAVAALRSGAYDYLMKPSDVDELRATVNRAIERKQLRQKLLELEEVDRLKTQFLSMASHELRTPLTAVLGYLALMEEGLAGPVTPEQQHTLLQVKGSSEKLLELIGDLLELTSLKRGELVVNLTEFDPRDPLKEALASPGCKKAGVSLVVAEAAVLPMMNSDKRKVTRLVAALLDNAFKFTEKGEVRVSIKLRDGQVVYRITDTGVGISDDAQRFVFDEFRQEDGSATRRYGGSGLGLAIARRLAQLLGGEISLSSQQGRGSTFTAQLPLAIKK